MIPNPRECSLQGQSFLLPAELSISGEAPLEVLAQLQQNWQILQSLTGFKAAAGCLQIRFHPFARLAASHKDMHLIMVEPGQITLSAKSDAGFRYALQSLTQLLYIAISRNEGLLQCQTIVDYPEFSWRGLHLDESRHFFGEHTVMRILRMMAALKLNRFHWHLSDDQGWRVESKLFPRLTEIGAWRKEADGSLYGGFYSQEEIRRIIAYADALGIEIIPELDLPGHTLALLAAYPELACFPGTYEPSCKWGVFTDILCPGKDAVMDFLGKLLREMATLFSGSYFHIGGDEAPKQNWKSCPDCQTRISAEGLRGEEELQSWFTQQLLNILKQEGKSVIGWDEILDGKISSSPIVMVWRGEGKQSASLASANGNRFILCPNSICYFDWRADAESPGAHGISTLQNVYGFAPATYGLPEFCLGGQANLWTEHMHNPTELFNMLLPRAFALSEAVWNPNKDFAGFQTRLSELEAYLETLC